MCRCLLCCIPCRNLWSFSAVEFGVEADNGFAAHDVASHHRRMSIFWFLVGVLFSVFFTSVVAAICVFLYGSLIFLPDMDALVHG